MSEKFVAFEADEKRAEAERESAINLSPGQCWVLIDRKSRPDKNSSAGRRTLVILDVRTAQEYHAGRIIGSINIDFRSPRFMDLISELERDKAYLLYCRTGVRSQRALQIMRRLGFVELYNLTGGLVQWLKEGGDAVSD